jgi:hypothetical protein
MTGTGSVTPYYTLLSYPPLTFLNPRNTVAINTTQVAAGSVATTATGVQQVGKTPLQGNFVYVGNGCMNPGATHQTLMVTTSGTTNTQLIAKITNQAIYVCYLSVLGVSGTTPTFQLWYAGALGCANNYGALTWAFSTSSTTTPTTFGPGLVTVTQGSNALCYLQTGTTPVAKVIVDYVQQ